MFDFGYPRGLKKKSNPHPKLMIKYVDFIVASNRNNLNFRLVFANITRGKGATLILYFGWLLFSFLCAFALGAVDKIN